MKRVIFETVLGVFLFIAGIVIAYIYASGFAESPKHWLLIPLLAFAGAGIVFLIRAGKSGEALFIKKGDSEVKHTSQSKESIIKRNNEIVAEWNDTNAKRDKLHMLQLASPEEKTLS
jgi:hypothetical protein